MELNMKERKTYEVIKKVIDGEITREEAMEQLQRSRQQIYRFIKKFYTEGEQGFVHKSRGKVSSNKKDDNIIKELETLYLNEYYDYNLEAFYEEIESKYDISYSLMVSEFKKDDIISPLAHKETIKLYNEKMNKAINDEVQMQEEKIELFKSRQIAFEKAHTRRSSNMYGFGQEVQMDACEKVWFGNVVSYLHLAVDKGTKKVLFGWFEYEELTRGYFVLIYNIIINYGIPEKIKADNRNSFSNNKNQVDATQFGTICNMLGIKLETTSIATSKANVERENATFKNRLIAELRHEDITDIDEVNKYLNEVFIPKMNKKFSYEINSNTSKMKPNHYTEEELNLIISEKYTRIIDNASSIKYNGKYYVPIDSNTGEVVCFIKKTQCTFLITYNAEYWCEIENNYYQLTELESREKIMKKEKDNNLPLEKKKYIPPANHPWRKNMMLRNHH
ncbi:TPA: helix-turn-helix domain-containing protein [Candidatus Ventrenecus stercoripullorum]|nr:helix-turn-helix domain-containing protein [Candidatus Ventrenecus stercoripullorum]